MIFRAFKKQQPEPELIDELEGHDFENYCASLLEKNHFQNVQVTKGSGDFGLDILAEKDGVTYGIQCKRYDKPIGVAAVQQAYLAVATVLTIWIVPKFIKVRRIISY